MKLLIKENHVLEGKVTLTLTQKDILLLELCLQLVARHFDQKGTLGLEVQRLRDKLSKERQALVQATRRK